jgi:hypothetical protein
LEKELLSFPRCRFDYANKKTEEQINKRAEAENLCVSYRDQFTEAQRQIQDLEGRLVYKEQERIRLEEKLDARDKVFKPMQQNIFNLYKQCGYNDVQAWYRTYTDSEDWKNLQTMIDKHGDDQPMTEASTPDKKQKDE